MANDTMEATKEEAANVAGTATQEAQSLAESAQREAQQVTQTAKEQVANVVGEAQAQAETLKTQALSQVREQADAQAQRAVAALRSYEAEVQALCEGRPEDAPTLVQRLQQTSSRAADVADGLERRGIEGVLDDVQRFARRRPGLFLAGAAVAGFALTRILRTSRQADAAAVTSGPSPSAPVALPAAEPLAPAPLPEPSIEVAETYPNDGSIDAGDDSGEPSGEGR